MPETEESQLQLRVKLLFFWKKEADFHSALTIVEKLVEKRAQVEQLYGVALPK